MFEIGAHSVVNIAYDEKPSTKVWVETVKAYEIYCEVIADLLENPRNFKLDEMRTMQIWCARQDGIVIRCSFKIYKKKRVRRIDQGIDNIYNNIIHKISRKANAVWSIRHF